MLGREFSGWTREVGEANSSLAAHVAHKADSRGEAERNNGIDQRRWRNTTAIKMVETTHVNANTLRYFMYYAGLIVKALRYTA